MRNYLFVIVFVILVIVVTDALALQKRNERINSSTKSSDGHVVPKHEDLTCETNEGHRHLSKKEREKVEAEFGKRYVVHNEVETGYVILNGVKRKLSDCSKL